MKTEFTPTLSKQLDSYKQQAIAYQQTNKQGKKFARVGALATLAPLAAISMLPSTPLQAQCNVGNVTPVGTVSNSSVCPDIRIDIDGDGDTDIILAGNVNASGIYIDPTSSVSIVGNTTTGTSIGFYASRLPANASITAGLNFMTVSGGTTGAIFYMGNGQFGPGTTGFLAISVGGQLGFVEITINANGCPVIGDYGIEGANDPTPNAASAGDCSSLPVELIAFRAAATDGAIRLEWETASEIENLGFELQRSTNGKDFQKVTWIAGHLTSNEVHQYSYTDEKVLVNEQYYYRLKQVDVDGAFNYSEVISASINDADKLRLGAITPNPTQGLSYLPVSVAQMSDATIQLFTSTGKEVWNKTQVLESGEQRLELDVQDLPQGAYFMKITIANEVNYRKLIIE